MAKFFVSRSAIQNAYVRKPKGFEAWFYTGVSRTFRSGLSKKKSKRK